MLVACLGDVMLDVIVEPSGAWSTTTTPPRGSRSPPAARPPTSPPGWSPWAAGPGCSVPARTPAPGHLVERALTGLGVEVVGHAPPAAPGPSSRWSPVAPGRWPRTPATSAGSTTCRSGPWLDGRRLAVRLRLRAAAHARPAARRGDRRRRPGARHPGRGRPVVGGDGRGVRRRPVLRAVPGAAPVRGVRDRHRVGAPARARSGPAGTRCWSSSTARAVPPSSSRASPTSAHPATGPVVDVTGAGDALAAGLPPGRPRPGHDRRGPVRRRARRPAAEPAEDVDRERPAGLPRRRGPAERAGLAVQPLQRTRRPVGEHRRLARRAELRRGRSPALPDRCAPGCWPGSRTGSSTAC